VGLRRKDQIRVQNHPRKIKQRERGEALPEEAEVQEARGEEEVRSGQGQFQ
jgi:hypothetical protein